MLHVRLTARGNTVLIVPWCPDVLKAALTAKRRERRIPFVPGRSPWIYKEVPLYDAVARKTACTHVGMLPRVIRTLKRKRCTYELLDERESPVLPDLSAVGELRQYQPEVLAAVCCGHFGVINCATGMGKTYMIEQLCKMYTQIKILVVSGSRTVVDSLYERVCEACPDRKISKHSGSHKFKPDSEIVVSTIGVLYKIPNDWPKLLLYDEAHEAGSPTGVAALIPFSGARRFGLSASPSGRSDGGDRLVEALFGPEIAHVTYQEAEEAGLVAPIECRFMRVDQCAQITGKGDIARKRNGYWRNYQRNKVLAAAARSFGADVQTLVFVEKTEHALNLRKMLPEYTVVHGGIGEIMWRTFVSNGVVSPEDKDKLMSPKATEIRRAFEDNTLKKVICTTIWNKGVDFPYLEVLVRGDGQSSKIPCTQIPGRLSRAGSKSKGILIDVDDQFDLWFASRSDQRKAHYHDQGWTIINNWGPQA